MRRVLLVLLPLLLAPLAGCLTPPEETLAAAADAAEGKPLNATVADWFVLDAVAGPAAPLTGFWWTVPEGAVVDTRFSWDDEKATSVIVEVAVLSPEGEDPDLSELGLFAYVKDEGALQPLLEAAWTPFTQRSGGILDAGEPEREEMRVSPFYAYLGVDVLEVGDEVGFVVGARADEATPYRLAFRALEREPREGAHAADDAEEFLREREGRAPIPLTPGGVGEGMQFAFYVEMHGFWFPMGGYEAWTDAVQVETVMDPDAGPVAHRRTTTLSADFPRGGHSSAFGVYWGMNTVGEWSAKVDLHGEAAEGGGRVAEVVFPAGAWLSGIPAYAARGEGAEGAASRLHVETLTAAGWELLLFMQTDVGATLGTLLGEDAHTDAHVSTGALGGVRAGRLGDDLFLVGSDGATRVVLNALPQ